MTERSSLEILNSYLKDIPENCIPKYLLEHNLCSIYSSQNVDLIQASVLKGEIFSDELFGYGRNISALLEILARIKNWRSVNVEIQIVQTLSNAIEKAFNVNTTVEYDIYSTLNEQNSFFSNNHVRRLTLEDYNYFRNLDKSFLSYVHSNFVEMLNNSIVAGAIVSNKIVSIVSTGAYTKKYIDISAYTAEQYRNKGYAKAALTIVSNQILELGKIPIWSTSEKNKPSVCVMRESGFNEVAKRAYIILEKPL